MEEQTIDLSMLDLSKYKTIKEKRELLAREEKRHKEMERMLEEQVNRKKYIEYYKKKVIIPPEPGQENFFDRTDFNEFSIYNLEFREWKSGIKDSNKIYCPFCNAENEQHNSKCNLCGFDLHYFKLEVQRYEMFESQAVEELRKNRSILYDEYAQYLKGNTENNYGKNWARLVDTFATQKILQERAPRIIAVNNIYKRNETTKDKHKKAKEREIKDRQHTGFFRSFDRNLIWMVPTMLILPLFNGGIPCAIILFFFIIYGLWREHSILKAEVVEDELRLREEHPEYIMKEFEEKGEK